MEFPWRCNVDTIAMDLKVSWEMSAKIGIFEIGNYAWVFFTPGIPPMYAILRKNFQMFVFCHGTSPSGCREN